MIIRKITIKDTPDKKSPEEGDMGVMLEFDVKNETEEELRIAKKIKLALHSILDPLAHTYAEADTKGATEILRSMRNMDRL